VLEVGKNSYEGNHGGLKGVGLAADRGRGRLLSFRGSRILEGERTWPPIGKCASFVSADTSQRSVSRRSLLGTLGLGVAAQRDASITAAPGLMQLR
jgi:hypothetical protein